MATDANQKHRIRLSIDIQSVRNNNFQGNIYVKYKEVPNLGVNRFRTPSCVQLFNKHIEEQFFSDGFCSYEFDVSKEDLVRTIK